MYFYNGKQVDIRVEIYPDVVPYLGEADMIKFLTDPVTCGDAWEKAKEKFYAVFGESLPMRAVSRRQSRFSRSAAASMARASSSIEAKVASGRAALRR